MECVLPLHLLVAGLRGGLAGLFRVWKHHKADFFPRLRLSAPREELQADAGRWWWMPAGIQVRGGLSAIFLLNFSLTFWMSVIKSKTFETDDPFFSQNSLTKLEKFYRKVFPVESDCRRIWIFMIQTWEETSDKRVNGSPHQSRHVFDVITWSDCFCQFVWVSGDLLPRAGVSGRFHVVLWRQRSLGIE